MLVYAPSYPTLISALKRYSLVDIKVITSNSSIERYLGKISVDVIRPPELHGTDRGALQEYKESLDRFAAGIKGEEVYFAFNVSAIYDLYLIEQLAKQNKVFYNQQDPQIKRIRFLSVIKSKEGRKRIFNRIVYSNFFGIRPKVGLTLSNKVRLYVDTRELEQKYDQPSPPKNEVFQSNVELILGSGEEERCDLLYIDNSVIFESRKVNELAKELKRLSSKGIKILIKAHPNHPLPESMKGLPVMDKDIPAEIAAIQARLIIGVSSLSLSNIAEMGKDVYSLLPYFEGAQTQLKNLLEGVTLLDSPEEIRKIIDRLQLPPQ